MGYCRQYRRRLMPAEVVDIGALALALDTARDTQRKGLPGQAPAWQEMNKPRADVSEM